MKLVFRRDAKWFAAISIVSLVVVYFLPFRLPPLGIRETSIPWQSNRRKPPDFYRHYYADVWQRASARLNISADDIDDTDLDAPFTGLINASDDLSRMVQQLRTVYTQLLDKEPPDRYNKWAEYAYANKCPLHPVYYSQVHKDLAPFGRLAPLALK